MRSSFLKNTTGLIENSIAFFDFDEKSKIWTVNGGILSSALVWFAAQCSTKTNAVSVSANFVRGVKEGKAEAHVEFKHSSLHADCIGMRLEQNKKTCVRATVWLCDERGGPTLLPSVMPLVADPEELISIEDAMSQEAENPMPFWHQFEQRVVNRISAGTRLNRPARLLRWFRYKDFSDAELDDQSRCFSQCLPLIDTMGIPAAMEAHEGEFLQSLAPTLNLNCTFYPQMRSASDGWLLADAQADFAAGGLISNSVKIWSRQGHLLANGSTVMKVVEGKRGAYTSREEG